MASQKKVIVRRFLGDSLAGYLPAGGFVDHNSLALLDLTGRVTSIPLSELKFAAYVRDFNLSDAESIDRSLRRSFLARPRSEGLWVRITFRSGDLLEGLATPGLSLLDEVLDIHGLQLTPPDTRGNTQRIYVPRIAMTRLELLGVVSPTTRYAASRRAQSRVGQDELFPDGESR